MNFLNNHLRNGLVSIYESKIKKYGPEFPENGSVPQIQFIMLGTAFDVPWINKILNLS